VGPNCDEGNASRWLPAAEGLCSVTCHTSYARAWCCSRLTLVAVAPQYTMEEIGRHNKPDDLWLVVDNRVYDVSKWAKHHPGGHLCMENVAGADATDAFENYHPAYVQPPGLVVFRQWLFWCGWHLPDLVCSWPLLCVCVRWVVLVVWQVRL